MLLHESVQTNWKQLALNSLFSALITAVVAVIVFSIAQDPILGGLLTLAGIVLSLSSIGRFSYLEIGSRAHLLIRCSVPITFLLHIPISVMGWYWLQHRAFLDEVTTASTNGAMTGSSLSTLWVHVLTSLHPQPSSTLAHTSHPRLLHSSIPLSVTFLFLILYNGTAVFSRMRGGEEESSSSERKLRHGIFSMLNLSSVAENQPATTVQTAHVLMMHVTSWVLGSVTGLSLELSNCLHDHAAQFALATMQAILVNALAGFVLSHIWFHFFQDHHWNAETFETE